MIRLELCTYTSCPKSKECYRTVAEIGINGFANFKNICGDWNNYKYYYEIGDKPTRKEELEN